MISRRVLFAGARLCFFTYVLLTSLYCLLAYIPFTYVWAIKFNVITWFPEFARLHPFLYWLALAVMTPTLTPDLRRPETKRITVWFFIFHIAVGAALLFYPLLASVENDGVSFCYSVVALFPLLWISVIDYVGHASEVRWSRGADESFRLFSASMISALFLSLLYFAISYLRLLASESAGLEWAELLVAACSSVVSHLLVFMGVFLSLRLISAISSRFSNTSRVEFLLCSLLASILGMLILRKAVLPAIAFSNYLASVFSVVASVCIAAFFMGLGIRLYRAERGQIEHGLALALILLTPRRLATKLSQVWWIAIISVLAYIVPASVAIRDWDFLVQKLSVLAVWILTFAFFYKSINRRKTGGAFARMSSYPVFVLLLFAATSMGFYKWSELSEHSFSLLSKNGMADAGNALERYAGYDLSFKVVREILSPAVEDEPFYSFLNQNTNLLPSIDVPPVEVNLVPEMKPAQGVRPNIFVFVIDSLRRDYLSPYNRSVTFTPNIESFARDSVVMEKPFTRYGGTGLAEPSIWVGGMLLHKQYITPFRPMNALQKLVDMEGYQSYISIDTILKAIGVGPSKDVVELDKGLHDSKHDFCASLEEMQSRIDTRPNRDKPIFAYMQPQNIHTHIIALEGHSVPPGEQYPGFYAPYASRVRRMDRCFGEFLQYLKDRGLYENSIVILTSDHGDFLGEEGKWGHSHWIFPEIIKVPLIIHLPPVMREKLYWDTKSVAFTADITPSLYYLLGHRPIVRNEIFGRPLFTASEQEHREYLKESHMIVSSYGAVYGIVSDNGRSLYIADGVNNKDYFFDLSNEAGAGLRFTSAKRAEQKRLIRDLTLSINRFYNYGQGQEMAFRRGSD